MTCLLSLLIQLATLDAYYFEGWRVVAREDDDG
jgi:hypothetical protein